MCYDLLILLEQYFFGNPAKSEILNDFYSILAFST